MMGQEGWRLQPDKCRADLDFLDWAADNDLLSVFHMGPGLHHQVGLQLSRRGTFVTSITASPAEAAVWTRMLARRPGTGARYVCILQDIYEFRPQALSFDVINLFHLGEMLDAGSFAPALTLARLMDRLQPGGRVIFYTGSSAWDRVAELPRSHPALHLEDEYRGLEVWRA